MDVSIRPTEPGDQDGILGLVFEAFNGPDHDGHEEVGIVERTWRRNAAIDGLELVALVDRALVGHVLGARADLDGHEVVAVAPLCVRPSHQNRGIGGALMNQLIDRAENQRWPLIVLLGDPGYYGRFGFEPSSNYGIRYQPVADDNPHFMVRRTGSFDSSLRGRLRYCWELSAPSGSGGAGSPGGSSREAG